MHRPSENADCEINSCWVGPQLLPIANACINSFAAHGFKFNLYIYGDTKDVPEFAEKRNGEELVPRERIFVAHGGVETFTDLFGITFLEQVGGWWVDNDVVCNTDRLPDIPVAFAEEAPRMINNAVLKFPRNHEAIVRLLDYVETVDPVTAPWGSTGPRALTRIFTECGIAHLKQDTAAFYPLHWKEAPKVLFPEFTDEVLDKTRNSPFIHLWGSAIREIGFDFARYRPLEGSYLHDLYERCLDRPIAERLVALDEGAFRRSVQGYVSRTWNIDLKLCGHTGS